MIVGARGGAAAEEEAEAAWSMDDPAPLVAGTAIATGKGGCGTAVVTAIDGATGAATGMQ